MAFDSVTATEANGDKEPTNRPFDWVTHGLGTMSSTTTDESTTELHQVFDDPVERQQVLDWRIVEDAWMGKRGDGQERIAKAGMAWLALILRKNRDYGNSAWQTPVLAPECSVDTAIRVRMSDKINRLQNLLKGNSAEISESINDTIRDLGAYCLLLLTCPPDQGKIE